MTILARDRRGPNIMAQVLLYPSLDFDFTTESYQKYSKGFILTEELMTWFAGHYAESREDLLNNLAAPLLTGGSKRSSSCPYFYGRIRCA